MRKSYSQWTRVQGDDHGILQGAVDSESDRRDPRVSEIDGERQVDAVRDE